MLGIFDCHVADVVTVKEQAERLGVTEKEIENANKRIEYARRRLEGAGAKKTGSES